MHRFLIATVFVLTMWGCGHEKRMMHESTAIVTSMVELLEAHTSNPPSVLPALREFMLENRTRMNRLEKASKENSSMLGEKERFRMKVQFVREMSPLKERLKRVAKVYRDNPEVIESMKEVIGTLKSN